MYELHSANKGSNVDDNQHKNNGIHDDMSKDRMEMNEDGKEVNGKHILTHIHICVSYSVVSSIIIIECHNNNR